MKKDFSFYEFVGLIVPGVILLFFAYTANSLLCKTSLIDIMSVGGSLIFLILAYGTGHLLHALGSLYDFLIWWIAGGMPSEWPIKKNRFGGRLFDKEKAEAIQEKLHDEFGTKPKKFGFLVISKLRQVNKSTTAEIFNGNYSLMRALAVAFFSMGIASFFLFTVPIALLFLILSSLATLRMIQFGLFFAREIYNVYLTI